MNGDGEEGAAVGLFDGADVAAALVHHTRTPVEAHDLVADGVDVVGRVEGRQLVRQDLAHRQERQRSYPQQRVLIRVVHHRSNLPRHFNAITLVFIISMLLHWKLIKTINS